MQNNPLNKVVFIQKVAAFTTKKTDFYTKTKSLKQLFQLAYVNNSWNDTIKNYAFHIFEQRVCAIDHEDIITLEILFENSMKWSVIWFVNILISSKSLLNRINLPMLVCKHRSPSVAMMRFVFEKIVEVGGKDMLKSQLTATNRGGLTCLMQCCCSSSSPEVTRLLFEKINESGGPVLLESQLVAINSDGLTCLMFGCGTSSSPEVMKLVFEKIVSVGGKDLLRSQLTATDTFGRNCLMLCCSFSSSPEVLKMLAVLLFELNLFVEQYATLRYDQDEKLSEKAEIKNASWVPDPESIAEVKKMLKR